MKNSKYFISIHMSKNTNIYTSCWVYIQIHSFKKYVKINTTWKKSFFPKVLSKHASWPFHWLTTYFGKKRKENKYKVEKHHIYIYIYTTQWWHYTISLILFIKKKKTHTKQYYLMTVQLNKEKSNSNLKNTKKLPES